MGKEKYKLGTWGYFWLATQFVPQVACR
jgi:hypothetical protein